jgi:hypothetical protein
VTDVLIRNVPDEDLQRIDAKAARLGLSRGEYLRRQIAQDAARAADPVTVDTLRRAAELSADLLDDDLMRDAWS